MKKISILGLVLFTMFLSFGNSGIQSGQDLFQKALAKERAEGNLEEAIILYQRIINESQDKSLKAQAQLRIGLSYEKLGEKNALQAQDAFQKVIDNYPSQSEEVKAAKERLSNLIKVRSSDVKSENEFKIEVVWPKPKWGIEGSLSPDGRYLSFVDWDTCDLSYRDLASGKNFRLTDLASHPERQESAYDSFWSPDSKQIAYCWENDLDLYYDIRVMNLDSKEHKTLYRVGYFDAWIAPCGWTSDGRHILIRLIEEKFKFGLLSVADGSLQIIKELDFFENRNRPGFIQFSPDGQYIAYDFQQNVDISFHDIFILSSDGSINTSLATHPAHDYFLGWAPDGKRIFFASERTGALDLWIVSVENGKQNGDPVLLRRNIGSIKPLGITRDGSFFFNTDKGEVPFDIHTATLDSRTGGVLSPQKKLVLPYQGNNKSPSWSPDGKHIAYISMRGMMNQRTLCIYSVETGRIRTILNKSDVGLPRWSSDGRSIFVHVSGEGFFKVDVRTEEFIPVNWRKIEQDKELAIASLNMSLDNNYLFYIQFDRDNTVTHVMARDLKTEKEKELYSIPLYEHNMVLSPDGRNLALLCSEDPYENKKKKHVLKIIPVAGEEVREITNFEQVGGWGLVRIAWSPDGKFVYFSKLSSEQSGEKPFDWELWKIPIEGGHAEKTGLKIRGIPSFSIHPDGKQIVWSSHSLGVELAPEVWVMKNFLPKTKDKK